MRRRCGALSVAILIAMLVSGCTVGPNYKRPAVATPQAYRGEKTVASQTSFGEERWADVFQDAQLQKLIHTALVQNYDVRIAATRVAQAQAQLTIARSAQYPGAGDSSRVRAPEMRRRSFLDLST